MIRRPALGAPSARSWRTGPARERFAFALVLVAVGAAGLALGAGCSDPCCTTDAFPILLQPPTADGAQGLVALARHPDTPATTFSMSVDTSSALTLIRRTSEPNQVVLRDFDILDGTSSPARPVVRGRFTAIEVLPLQLPATGPAMVLGGALLQNFSVEFDFARPSITLWSRQGASNSFLSTVGFAVLGFNLAGGGELTARSRPDFLGLTGPVEVPATRVVLRACAGPEPFDPLTTSMVSCCERSEAVSGATGANLALLVATGVGPLVLSRSAWDRLAATQTAPLPEPTAGAPLSIPTLPAPVTDVLWSTLPRLALVNQELDDATNPGACVELARARRLERVENFPAECVRPCDTDPRDSAKAQNAAAYVEFGEPIPVAILPDSNALLQGFRAEIRPEGPELDGLLGANVLAQTTMELDYRSTPGRAIVTCRPDAVRTTCRASPRCQRLGTPADFRSCFGLRPRSLSAIACDEPLCGR